MPRRPRRPHRSPRAEIEEAVKLRVVPVDLSEANAFVAQHHRHHRPVVGHKFSIGAHDGENLVGVAIVGRPVARHRDDGDTLEVTRLCTDGTKNACSFLYAAAWRAASAMGYSRLGTYILATETGATLKASGWTLKYKTEPHGIGWNSRGGRFDGLKESKTLWEVEVPAPKERKR